MKTKIDTKTLWRILSTESESHNCEGMAALMVELLGSKKSVQVWRDSVGNVYAVKGAATVYPCIVAHLDTVHDIAGEAIVPVQIGERVTGMHASSMSQTGIGGDDKCGLYAALHCLRELPVCKVALFVDEEVGCIGSGAADMSFFADVAFCLQADRRGGRDFVTSIGGVPLSSADWLAAIKPLLDSHGMTCTAGAMTDVEALRDNGIGVCVANMSAGYYNPHTPGEYIHLGELANICGLMVAICREHGGTRWEYTPPAKKARRWSRWEAYQRGEPAPKADKFPDWSGDEAEELERWPMSWR